MRQTPILFFKTFFCLLLFIISQCSISAPEKNNSTFTFTTADVGQGLSQIGSDGENAVVWDMGPPCSIGKWEKTYISIGKPHISFIVVSHDDLDHTGGLYNLPETVDFSGKILCSPYSDTAMIRENTKNQNRNIRFEIISENDSFIFSKDIIVNCIWPPDINNIPETFQNVSDKNIFSLCFIITYNQTSLFITSDIDSVVEKHLSNKYGNLLKSDVFLVPHHGSRGSLNPVFYGYVDPAVSIISCGKDNYYGHPDSDVIKLLAIQMGSRLFDTRFEGSVSAISNGEYWSFYCESG